MSGLLTKVGGALLAGFVFAPGRLSAANVTPFGPSLDRIVPELGYIPSNVRVVCLMVNLGINEWCLENFMTLVNALNGSQR